MDNMKTPEECENLAEIRREIDRLDQHLIGTLAERFKRRWRILSSQSELAQRRLWAEQQGLNPQVVEKLFNDLVKYFIAEEMKHWEGSPS